MSLHSDAINLIANIRATGGRIFLQRTGRATHVIVDYRDKDEPVPMRVFELVPRLKHALIQLLRRQDDAETIAKRVADLAIRVAAKRAKRRAARQLRIIPVRHRNRLARQVTAYLQMHAPE